MKSDKPEKKPMQAHEALYLDTATAADLICISPDTLRTWRSLGRGPVFYKFNRKVLYKREDLVKWAAEHYACVDPATSSK